MLQKISNFWNANTENKIIISAGVVIALLFPCALCLIVVGLSPVESSSPAPPTIPPPPDIVPAPLTDTPVPPTATPEPTPTTPAISLEAQIYAVEAGGVADLYAEAMGNLSELLQNPQIGSDDWVVSVGVNIAVIRELENSVKALNPPADMQHIHDEFLLAASNCSTSMDFLVDGLDNLDIDALNTAGDFMLACGNHINRAAELTDEYLSEKGL